MCVCNQFKKVQDNLQFTLRNATEIILHTHVENSLNNAYLSMKSP